MSATTGSPWAGVHVLADDDACWRWSPVEQAAAACDGGAPVVQLRAKRATDGQTLAWGRAIRERTRRAGVRFVVNDRFDLALAVGADGVHLGQGDLPPQAVRDAAGVALAIGRSTHTPEEWERAREEPVDYVAFGPVFGTTSKATGYDARGLDALGAAARAVAPRPLVAIGGIDAEHVAAVRAAGAAGAAVLGAVAGAADPCAAVAALVHAFGTRP